MFQDSYDNMDELRLDRVARIILRPQITGHQRVVALTELQCIDRKNLPEGKQQLYDEYSRFLDQPDL